MGQFHLLSSRPLYCGLQLLANLNIRTPLGVTVLSTEEVNELRENIRQCERLAELAGSEREREEWEALAVRWRKLLSAVLLRIDASHR